MKIRKMLWIVTALATMGSLVSCGIGAEAHADGRPSAENKPVNSGVPHANAPEGEADAEPVGKAFSVTIPAPSMEGNLAGDPAEGKLSVYLPHDYGQNGKNYPVLYFLGGFGGDYEEGGRLLEEALGAWRAARNHEFIAVSTNCVNRFGSGYYANSPVTGNWEDFITKDVVNYMDRNYRTIADPSGRGLCGHSVGGSGVITIAMHQPGIFGYAYAMSPAMYPTNLQKYMFDFSLMKTLRTEYAGMDKDAAIEDYHDRDLYDDFTLAYASAFAYDEDGMPPYAFVPETEEEWKAYYEGTGNIPQKVERYKEALLQLESLMLDYGDADELRFVPECVKQLAAAFDEQGITYQCEAYDGGHSDKLGGRLKDVVIPWFAGLTGPA